MDFLGSAEGGKRVEDVCFVIMCAGKSRRWRNYLGIPNKYLIPIDGEMLAVRTARMIRDRGFENVFIVSDSPVLSGLQGFVRAKNERGEEIDRFYNCFEVTKRFSRSCYLFGDTYYTDDAMDDIVSTWNKDVLFFGRQDGLKLGKRVRGGGEIFSVNVSNHEFFANAVDAVFADYRSGKTERCQGWEVYRRIEGIRYDEHEVRKRFYRIEDITSDFDDARDYQRWMSFHYRHVPLYKHLERVMDEYGVTARGVLHVGGHVGQELPLYNKIGFQQIRCVEPIPEFADVLRFQGAEVLECAVGERAGSTVELYKTSNTEGSSVLPPIEHAVSDVIEVQVVSLDEAIEKGDFNCLVLDVQGAEMEVLRSGSLVGFDLIVCEISKKVRYKGAAEARELLEFLRASGFVEVESEFHSKRKQVRDAFFVNSARLA